MQRDMKIWEHQIFIEWYRVTLHHIVLGEVDRVHLKYPYYIFIYSLWFGGLL